MTRKKPYDPLEHCACRVCTGKVPPPDWDALLAVPDELVDAFETASLEAVHGHKSTSPIAEADAYVRGGLLPVLADHEATVLARVTRLATDALDSHALTVDEGTPSERTLEPSLRWFIEDYLPAALARGEA